MTDKILKKKESVFKKIGIRTCKFCDSSLVEQTNKIIKLLKSRNQIPYIQDGFNGDYYLTEKYNKQCQDYVCPKCEGLEKSFVGLFVSMSGSEK